MPDIGASTLAFLDHPRNKAIEMIKEMGFDFCEVIMEKDYTKEHLVSWGERSRSLDIGLSIHAPFSDLNIASLNNKIRETSIGYMKKAIEAASFLGAGPVTFHSGRKSPLGMRYPEKAWATNLESIGRLVDIASENGVRLCLENFPNYWGVFCCTIEEIKEVINTYPSLEVTLDTGHANTCGDVLDFFGALGPSIGHIHLHDNDGKDDHHYSLGDGTMDLKRLAPHLKSFKHGITIETNDAEDTRRSLETLKSLL